MPKPLPAAAAAPLLALVVVLWGVNWPIMAIGLKDLPPLLFATARLALGAATLFAVQAVLGRLTLPPRQDLPVVLSVGVLQSALFLALVHYALRYVPPGRSAILAYTTPLWVAPLAWTVLGERLRVPTLAALALGGCGLVILFNPAAVDYGAPDTLIGNGLLLAAAMAWAGAIVHVRAHRWQASPFALIPWQMLLAALLVAPVAAVVEPLSAVTWTARLGWVLAYNGPIASAFCFWAFISVNRALPAATTALASLGVPVVGLLASAAMVGEPLTTSSVLGLAAIVAGTAVLVLGGMAEARRRR